jgi:outer membrane biosynthesis protein TonB
MWGVFSSTLWGDNATEMWVGHTTVVGLGYHAPGVVRQKHAGASSSSSASYKIIDMSRPAQAPDSAGTDEQSSSKSKRKQDDAWEGDRKSHKKSKKAKKEHKKKSKKEKKSKDHKDHKHKKSKKPETDKKKKEMPSDEEVSDSDDDASSSNSEDGESNDRQVADDGRRSFNPLLQYFVSQIQAPSS